ncbi:sel1 repeat family protein [Microbulbifer sp. OS29]|uniref:Sel1 repeat family protein n=1 Tax=Microbulbifer okhotskensis TaxID=2926617 RepID=A0A9X2J719_9GAMM|nr:tetratricopeptide repeat protein [Microbulbifer okhotskensis]MCO1335310.1 sel1 repeat family protein [Microbulbifer okhotskensis]
MMKKTLFASCVVFLASCASQPAWQPGNNHLSVLTEQIAAAPESVHYEDFWAAYLESPQPVSNIEVRDRYLGEVTAIESGKKTCEAVNWRSVANSNVLSLMPHLTAAECYESIGNTEQANYHQNIFQFIATGILSERSGDSSYSAYEVASWADAEDLLTLSGYEIIDSYFEFANSRNAIYRVYNVKGLDTSQISKVYFDNARFLHRLLDIQYPFAGTSDQLFTDVIQVLASSDYAARHAEGTAFHAEKQYAEAEEAYLDAIIMGSVSANLSLGSLCLNGKSLKFSRNECAQLFVAAADLGLEQAKVYLAYMSYLGLGLEADKNLAETLLASAAEHMPQGQAEYELYSYFASAQFAPVNQALAEQYLQASVNKSYPMAMFTQAIGYLQKDNYHQFEPLIQQAASAEFPPAQLLYASYLLEEKQDIIEGMTLLNKAAAAGHPPALYERARIAQRGQHDHKVDLNQAIKDYEAAALRDFLPAQLKMGAVHSKNLIADASPEIAYAWYLLCGRAGNIECITNMGYATEHGYGVEQDLSQSAELYKLAAQSGSAISSARLGTLYETGRGVEQNLDQALSYFTQAAEAGLTTAMNKLGLMYLDSSSVINSYTQALYWFEQAAQKNSKYGYFNQARMFEQGLGVDVNPDKALSLYKEASKLGHNIASLRVAEAYSQGESVGKNIQLVYHYLKLAAEQSNNQKIKQVIEGCTNTNSCNDNELQQVFSKLSSGQ